MIKCVIFDCDGTLVDSEPLSHLALEMSLREYGVAQPADDLMAKYKGWKMANVCAAIELEHSLRLRDTFVADYRLLVQQLFDEQLRPIPGVAQALAQIHLPMCVASSGPPQKIEQSLNLTGLKRFFGENIFSAYTINSWKPEPDLFLHAAHTMGFSVRQCVVVEDSEFGVQAALSAGMRGLWYTQEAAVHEDPDIVCFRDMLELPQLIQAMQ